MKQNIGILLLVLLVVPGLVGCSAILPTATPTPTSTLTPTATPTPTLTPTLTPTPEPTSTPTPAFSLPTGWRDYKTERFALALPEEWKTIDIDKEGIDAVLTFLKGLGTDWAKNTADLLSAEALQESLKLWAIDSRPAGIGYANANIVYQPLPFEMDIEDLCQQTSSAYVEFGFTLLETECGFKINDVDAARFKIKLPLGAASITQYQYLYSQGRDLWMLTLGVDSSHWSKYQSTFEQIAESFRVR